VPQGTSPSGSIRNAPPKDGVGVCQAFVSVLITSKGGNDLLDVADKSAVAVKRVQAQNYVDN
jgi:hypothetical protein